MEEKMDVLFFLWGFAWTAVAVDLIFRRGLYGLRPAVIGWAVFVGIPGAIFLALGMNYEILMDTLFVGLFVGIFGNVFYKILKNAFR